jgi:hypothetical protein
MFNESMDGFTAQNSNRRRDSILLSAPIRDGVAAALKDFISASMRESYPPFPESVIGNNTERDA